MKNDYFRRGLSCFFTFFFLSQSGCTLFLGNIKPVEEKSNNYGVTDLSLTNPEWVHIDSQETAGSPQSGIADIALQSKKTASIISINSACKSYDNDRIETLKELTHELLLGISEITLMEETSISIDNTEALQTTIQGKINREKMMLRTVVIQKNRCVYDLMFVSRPDRFKINEADFSRFVSSLKLK